MPPIVGIFKDKWDKCAFSECKHIVTNPTRLTVLISHGGIVTGSNTTPIVVSKEI